MLIQCQSCQTKYRLNLERIPNRKTFIKCKKCNAPIYLDPQEESSQPADQTQGVDAPSDKGESVGAVSGEDEMVMLSCDNCKARYRVAAAPLRRPGLTLKCTSCGNKFPVPEVYTQPPEQTKPPGDQADSPDFYPSAAATPDSVPLDIKGKEMPLPDDSRIDSLFDDLKVEAPLAEQRAETFTPADGNTMFSNSPGGEEEKKEAEKAYLDSISFDDANRSGGPLKKGTIPESQKHRFFMKPKDSSLQEAGIEKKASDDNITEGQPASPPIDGGAEPTDDLPPLPTDQPAVPQATAPQPAVPQATAPQPAVPQPETKAQPKESTDAASSEEDLPDLPGQEEPAPPDPSLPALADENNGFDHPNPSVPGQPTIEKIEAQHFTLSIVIAGLLLAITILWGYWIWNKPSASEGYAITTGQMAELKASKTRQGYFIKNKPSGSRLLILNGEVANQFSSSDKISWVRVEGVAYGNEEQVVRDGLAYAGNILTDEQLETWDLQAIQAYYGYINGRNDSNLNLPQGKSVPFQIVLPNVVEQVIRTDTKITGFSRAGKSIFIKTIR